MQKKSGLFEATAWYGMGNLVVRLVSFILLPLYSNLISVEQFGIYSLMMSVYAISGVFYQFGMNASLTNFYLKTNDESARKIIFSTIVNAIIILGLILTIIAFSISSFLTNKILGTSEYSILLILLFIIIFIETISNYILQLFKTLELSKKVVIYLFAGAIINLLLNIWFVYGLRMGIKGIILAHLLTTILVFILFRAAWMPYALNKFKEGNYRENFGKILIKVLAIGVFILLTVSFFADDMFGVKLFGKYLFNPIYKAGLIILPYVVIGYIFNSLASFYSLYPFTANKSYHFLISDGLGIISNLVFNFILIPIYGLLGAGIATSISFTIAAGYLYFISKDRIEILYPKQEIIVICTAGILFLLVGMMLNYFWIQVLSVLLFLSLLIFVVKLK